MVMTRGHWCWECSSVVDDIRGGRRATISRMTRHITYYCSYLVFLLHGFFVCWREDKTLSQCPLS